MRTRSSRFFVVLLHLVGCPQHFHNTFEGIVGVQPWPIVMETVSRTNSNDNENLEPVWLQSSDGRCIGPQGRLTADCGDATVWLPVSQPLRKRKRARMGLWSVDEEELDREEAHAASQGLVFYLVDRDVEDILEATIHSSFLPSFWLNPLRAWNNNNNGATKEKDKLHKRANLECLTHTPDGKISVEICDAKQHKIPRVAALPSWGWSLFQTNPDTDGGDNSDDSSFLRPAKKDFIYKSKNKNDEDVCAVVSTEDGSSLSLSSCHRDGGEPKVQLSLIRYRAAPASETSLAKLVGRHNKQEKVRSSSTTRNSQSKKEAAAEEEHVSTTDSTTGNLQRETPSFSQTRDLAHMAALDKSMHPELTSTRRLFMGAASPRPKRRDNPKPRIASLHNINPILLAGDSNHFGSSSGKKSKGGKKSMEEEKKRKRSLAHPESLQNSKSGAGTTMEAPTRKRARIPIHPYIAASKDEVWTDPQTGLQYFTDLSTYLGHDRQTMGRHTLMGVGQYRKAAFIKVYGIALYVSKRDVLADPFFEPYAHMSAEELRQHPEFYEHLRLHPNNFDRSILIQTNMQLSAETIRGSLKAEWTMLTEEAKELIMNSSLEPQPMNDRILEIIQDPSNPSKCSCVAVAPPELGADPTCCARGTELVFTWLKSGDVECRLNRRLVAVFPRRDIGEGIFFEYLRTDNPISPELLDHAVDGFPFLLAPLAQVKGVHSVPSPKIPSTANNNKPFDNPLVRAWVGFVNSVGSHASGMAGSAQRGMVDAANRAQQAVVAGGDVLRTLGDSVRALGDSARVFGDDISRDVLRRRDLFLNRASYFPSIMAKIKKDPIQTVKELMLSRPAPPTLVLMDDEETAHVERRLFKRYPWLDQYYPVAPDEIGPMVIHPTMNVTHKFFLFLVHFYLLVLFLASFPGSTTRFIRRSTRKLRRMSSADSDCSECDEFDADDYLIDEITKYNGKANPTYVRAAKLNFSPRYVRGVKLALSRNRYGDHNEEVTVISSGDDNSSSSTTVLTPTSSLKQKSLSYFL